jgi:SAM-dependent methyltransferase
VLELLPSCGKCLRLKPKGFKGRILDFGGGRKATYVPLLPGKIDLISVNIDQQYEPTHVVSPGEPLPFENDSFDGIICLNVLEHIYDTRFVLDEMCRLLRPGATMHVFVPFIFRVHGHPDDYSRHTASWWRETMQRVGFGKMAIRPEVWGKATSAQLIRGNGLWPWLTTWRNVLRDIARARIGTNNRDEMTESYGRRVSAVTPGWQIAVVK